MKFIRSFVNAKPELRIGRDMLKDTIHILGNVSKARR
jgi:hypothetical protein